ncbi:MAG TPA: ThuA domain-containing protein [Bacteroidales bacterium]|nr:ThuA domain-containing protein [Bacteroidales bacterium]
MKKQYTLILILALLVSGFYGCNKEAGYKTLIINGQNNHEWQESSPILKKILDETGMFTCEIMTTPEKGGDMTSFDPDFSKYKLVVIDYNGDSWSDKTNTSFVEFVKNGGGVVIYHAANNSFPAWKEYNEMTGLGGWGDRSEKDGPYIYYRHDSLIVDNSPGRGGSHGQRREFLVRTRITDHPVTKGLPVMWMHGTDELYSELRGPAKNMQVLATAFADSAAGGGTMRDEPMLMAITYGNGRIFHTAMGHADKDGGPAMQCAGFIVTLQRGAEWAVTGNVTQKVPFDFPNAAGVVLRPGFTELTFENALENIMNYDIGKSTKSLKCIQHHITGLAGDEKGLLEAEKAIVGVLMNEKTSVEAKKLLLRELSWMGTDFSVNAIKELVNNSEIKDEAEFALARLQSGK